MAEGTDWALHRKVEHLESVIGGVSQQIDLVGSGLNSVHTKQLETQNDLVQFRADFEKFRLEAQQNANLQQAETRVGALQDTIGRKFGHHEEVRRSATGMLQAFDVGLVSEETVTSISEQLMIKNPHYWLAPALVALAAWSADDRSLCERAVAEAHQRSPEKSSLFFALITRRQGRYATSVRWIRHYLNALDPSGLGRDFATVLEAVSQGAFTAAGRDIVQETLTVWRERLLDDDAAIQAQVDRWQHEIASYAPGTAQDRYPNLVAVSPQWDALDGAASGAGVHERLISRYDALLNAEIRPSERLEDAVDDILDTLVREYDVEELPDRKDLAYWQAIIDHHGDRDAAKLSGTLAQAALDETLDYLTIQTTSALEPQNIGVSTATQRVAVGACTDWFSAAHRNYTLGYRSALPSDVQAHFGGTHTVAASSFQLPDWQSSFNRPLAELETSLAQHWDSHVGPWVDSLRYDWKRALILPTVVAVGILVLIGLLGSFLVSFIIGAIVFAIWSLRVRSRHLKSKQLVVQAEEVLRGAKQESLHKLRSARAELDDWQREYQRKDGHVEQARQLIDAFRTADNTSGSAFERRTVTIGA